MNDKSQNDGNLPEEADPLQAFIDNNYRYTGRLRNVIDRASFGWIDQKTVVPLEGSPALDSPEGEGVYLRSYNCDRPLRDGMEVSFTARPDPKRKMCFTAEGAHELAESRLRGMVNGGVSIGIPDKELLSPSFRITACIDADVAAKLREQMAQQKKVARLLVVQLRLTGDEEHPTADETRQIVKLDSPLIALSFKSLGKHRVIVAVVCSDSVSEFTDYYLSVKNGSYRTTVISSAGDCFVGGYDPIGTGVVDVEIPAGLFAEKPFDYDWVNSFYKKNRKPADECAFRRRRIAVYPFNLLIRWPFILVMSVVRICLGLIGAALSWCIGMRGLSLKSFLRHPWATPIGYIWADVQIPIYAEPIEDEATKQKRHFIVPVLLHPGFWVLVVVGYVIWVWRSVGSTPVSLVSDPVELQSMLWSLTKFVGVTAISIAIVGYMVFWSEGLDWAGLFGTLGSRFSKWRGERRAMRKKKKQEKHDRAIRLQLEREEAREKLRRVKVEREVRELICLTTGPRVPDAKQLPFKPNTIYFKFLDLKEKVCKNFSAAA